MSLSTLELPSRASGHHPRRVLAVWGFCVAAITFWIGTACYLTALPFAVAMVAAVILALAVIPLAGRIAYIVWQDDPDG